MIGLSPDASPAAATATEAWSSLVYSLATAAPAECWPLLNISDGDGDADSTGPAPAGLCGRQRHMHVCCVESARMLLAESPLPQHRRESRTADGNQNTAAPKKRKE
jgi:hypothetical protein